MKLVFFVIIVIFAVFGVAHFILDLLYSFTKIKDDNCVMLVIPQINKNFDAEFALRSVIAKVRHLGKCGINQVICIDNGLDEKTRRECELICKDYDYISVMTPSQFKEKTGL